MVKRVFIIIVFLIIVFTIWFFIRTRPAMAPINENEMFLEKEDLIQEEEQILDE